MKTTATRTDDLQCLDIFYGLSVEKIDSLPNGFVVQEAPATTLLYRPEDLSERIFVLLEGQVDLYRLTLGCKRLVTRRLHPGSTFGEMALIGSMFQGGFAEAVEDSRVYVFTRECMLRIIEQHPEVAERVLLATHNHIEQLEERLEQASFSTVRVRLAHFLLANMDPKTRLVASYTQADIGDMIGALRQTVTETLTGLRRLGVVEVGHKRSSVLRVKALQRLVLEQ